MTYYPTHHCMGWPCPICFPQGAWPAPYYAAPLPPIQQGCICPPTSEKTCESAICPRKNHLRAAGAGHVSQSPT